MALALDDHERSMLAGELGDGAAAVGAAVADELYRVQVPVVVLGARDLAQVRSGDRVSIGADGAVTVG
jgi:hypothetical protein